MQSDQQYHGCGRVMNSYENHVGFDISANNAVGATNFPLERNVSSPRMELQPPENCLENYFIFNQTVDRSQMMFHPVIPQQFAYPGYNPYPTSMENNVERWNGNEVEKEISSPFTEDPDEINALLSLDNDDQAWESEEEEVSTARTNGYDGSSSPESSCNYNSKKTKFSSSRKAHGEGSSSSCNNERKRKKMQKMVNVLRGIVPGGQRLRTTAVLDEAVKYLKSLKVEVEQNGVDDTNNHV